MAANPLSGIASALSSLLGGGAVESKVAATGITGLLATAVIQTIQLYWPHLQVPSASLMALYVTIVTTVAGYLAPHTATAADANPPPA